MRALLNELEASRAALVALFRAGQETGAFHERHAAIVDQYFRRSLEESAARRRLFKHRSSFSFVAVGGYGRSELCVRSDIDLLVLFASRVPDGAKSLVQETLFPLWDIGFDLGYAVRTVKDCVTLARKDFEVLTSLLDARFIGGDSPVFLRMVESIEDKVLARRRDHFTRWLRDTDIVRMENFGDASQLLEPDLKKGIGGLRDVHHMMWLGRARHGIRSLRELETSGRLSHAELEDLEKAVTRIRCVRNHLHDLSGRKNDRLTFEYQPEIARRLAYSDHPGVPAVEKFLGDLHAAMATVKSLRGVVSRAFLEPSERRSGKLPLNESSHGFVLRHQEIHFPSATAVLENPLLLLRIFEEGAQTGMALSLEAQRLVREFLPLVDASYRHSNEVGKGLCRILASDNAADTLDQMFETRFLDALIPEFGEIRDRVQFDTYHLFPVGRHSLETVRALKEVARQKEILLSSMNLELQDPAALLLAALFHDIGKTGVNHAQRGEALVSRLLGRIHLEDDRIENAAFLVRHHLLLLETATRRDLADEKIVVQCARIIGTPDRLKMLYLLSWADARATGPRAWSEWIANLVQELFFKVLHILDQGELATPDASNVAQKAWEDVHRRMAERMPQEALEEAFEAMSSRYILNTPPADMARHLELLGRYSRRGEATQRAASIMDARQDEAGGCWELTFLARDRPGLFSMIAGVLALNRINILSSDIYTWRDRTVVDVFRVEDPGTGRVPEEVWKKVEGDLEKALEGKLFLAERLDRKAGPSVLHRPGRPKRLPKVRVDNEVSDFFTLIEVFADDRLGLLYEITRELTALGLDIRIARISTKGDQVADIFYVRDGEGQRVEEVQEIEAIQKALQRRLAQGQRGGQGTTALE